MKAAVSHHQLALVAKVGLVVIVGDHHCLVEDHRDDVAREFDGHDRVVDLLLCRISVVSSGNAREVQSQEGVGAIIVAAR